MTTTISELKTDKILESPRVQYLISNLSERKDRTTSFLLSLGSHIVFLLVGSILLIRPAQFGIDSGLTSIDIELIEALPEPIQKEEVKPVKTNSEIKPEMVISEPLISKPELVLNEIAPIKSVESPSTQPMAKQRELKQNFSEPSPIKQTHRHLSLQRGAVRPPKPNHLLNPAPRYPEIARKNGEEGVVIVRVKVDKKGSPKKVEVKQSSGFPLLDNSATKTIQQWTFEPAFVASMPIESDVEVPIRFRLN